jgi:hypothetical protein
MGLSGNCPSDTIHEVWIETNLSDIGLHGIMISDIWLFSDIGDSDRTHGL